MTNADIALQASAQTALQDSGCFTHWRGPYGAVPVQFQLLPLFNLLVRCQCL